MYLTHARARARTHTHTHTHTHKFIFTKKIFVDVMNLRLNLLLR